MLTHLSEYLKLPRRGFPPQPLLRKEMRSIWSKGLNYLEGPEWRLKPKRLTASSNGHMIRLFVHSWEMAVHPFLFLFIMPPSLLAVEVDFIFEI